MEIGGGYFNYEQNTLDFLVTEMTRILNRNGDPDFPVLEPQVVAEFHRTVALLKMCKIHMDKVDRLLSLNITQQEFLNELQASIQEFELQNCLTAKAS